MEGKTLSVRENYFKTIGREWGEWIPYHRAECDWIVPSFFMKFMSTPESVDMFGVPWVINDAGPKPDTTRPTLDSMADWRDAVNLPDLDAIDWEAMAARDLANVGDDKTFVCFTCEGSACSLFLPIMSMVGFEEGLLSFYKEPEAVHEFCECLTDFYCKVIDYEEKYYNPEIYCVANDLSSAKAPFISMDIYNEFLKPYYKQLFDRIKSYGKKIEFHLCGKAEPFIEDMMEMGLNIWQSAQPMNDFEDLKKKYGNRLVINGGWDSNSSASIPGADEETCRQAVRDVLDRLSNLGPSIFFGMVIGEGPEVERQNGWIFDEVAKYGHQLLSAKSAVA